MSFSTSSNSSSTSTWSNWVDYSYQTTSCTTASISNNIWYRWQPSTGASIGSGDTWGYWTADSEKMYYQPTAEKTKAELVAERKAERARQKAYKLAEQKRLVEEKKRQLADQTALKLLKQFLDVKQQKELEDMNSFYFVTDDGKYFRISKGRSHNIKEVEKTDDGQFQVIRSICRHPVAYVPDYDTMLSQFLELRNDWKAFISKANQHREQGNYPIPETRR
jgi:hypothetical protein